MYIKLHQSIGTTLVTTLLSRVTSIKIFKYLTKDNKEQKCPTIKTQKSKSHNCDTHEIKSVIKFLINLFLLQSGAHYMDGQQTSLTRFFVRK